MSFSEARGRCLIGLGNIRRLDVYQGRRFTAYIYQKNSGFKTS